MRKICSVVITLIIILSNVNSYSDSKSSLTFVIDRTMSMKNVINDVKFHGAKIFDAIVESEKSFIDNFILVTFDDPKVKIQTKTKYPAAFRAALGDIMLVSGGDCPERSISGIETALQESEPDSYIYVFTDASAKDFIKYKKVIKIAHDKNCQVVFLLTGRCKSFDDHGVYETIAHNTTGQVFNLLEDEMSSIIEYIKHSIISRRILLASKRFPPGRHKLDFKTDSHIDDVSVSISGEYAEAYTTDNSSKIGQYIASPDLKNIKIFNLVIAKPGEHFIEIGSKSDTSVIVTGESKLNFQHGFSAFIPSSINDTTIKPVPLEKSYLTIQLKGNINLHTARLIDLDNNVLKTLRLTVLSEAEKLFITVSFIPPLAQYRIAVKGIDTTNNETILRIGSAVVEPQIVDKVKDKAPTIEIGDAEMLVDEDEELILKCKVNAYPKPTIIWRNIDDGSELPTEVFPLELPYKYVGIYKTAKFSNATYECKARNKMGETRNTIEVLKKRKPYLKILDMSKDIKVNYKTEGQLLCKVDSYPTPKYQWYKDGIQLYTGVDKSTYKIRDMDVKDQGTYVCDVTNGVQMASIEIKVTISGVDKPLFDKSITSVYTTEGAVSTLYCNLLKGEPSPNYEWFFKDSSDVLSRINNSSDYVILNEKKGTILHIANTKKEHTGSYICVSRNTFGADSKDTELTVEFHPTVKVNPKFVDVETNTTVVLNCEVDGIPKADVTWSKNNVSLTDPKFHLGVDLSLHFLANLDDRGTYKCIAANKLGTDYQEMQLVVGAQPRVRITGAPYIQVEYNKKLRLECQIYAYPKPDDVLWTNDNGDITVVKVSSLNSPYQYVAVLNIDEANVNTTYECIASNKYGKNSAEVFIETTQKPYFNIVQTPKDSKVPYSSSHTLYCQIEAQPLVDITWYKDNVVINKVRGIDISRDRSQLTIYDMQPIHVGSYTCRVNNNHKAVNYSATITITGVSGPNIKQDNEIDVAVEEGNSKTLHCSVEGVPKPDVMWLKDDKPITNAKITIYRDHSLKLTDAKQEDTGIYKCFAKNDFGNETKTVNLVVYFLKVKTPINTRFSKQEGERVSLKCDISGFPKPDIKWYYNRNSSMKPEFLISNMPVYRIKNLKRKDTGWYTCEGTNIGGSLRESFYVDVLYAAEIISENRSPYIMVDGDRLLKLPCVAIGNPKPDITWKINGLNLAESDRFHVIEGMLLIRNINKTDTEGLYVCEATNSIYGDQLDFNVIVTEIPPSDDLPTRRMKVEQYKRTAIQCFIPHTVLDSLRWYRNGRKFHDGELILEVSDLNDAGLYTCRVSNEQASISANTIVEVGYGPRFIRNENTIVYAYYRTIVVISCEASGHPAPKIQWWYNGRFMEKETKPKLSFIMNNKTKGVYNCLVENEFGSRTRQFNVVYR